MTALADLATGSRPALVVDQCEETFTLCSDARERSAFLAALVEHARAAPLVLSFRADHLAAIVAFPAFARAVEQGMYLLGALEEPDLRAAIEGPARAGGFLLEAGLVDVLIAEVADQPGALPLLSHALSETWVRREGRTLTLDGYRETGGVRSAVAQSAESVYARFGVREQVVFRELLMRLVGPGSAGEPVRRRLPRRLVVTDPQHDAMVELLVGSRLVTTDDGVVELAHEALARAWPRLQDWLADDVDGQRILHHLAGAADSWESLGRPDAELYRGGRLAQALEWRNRATPQLTEVERDFLDAGEALSSAELRQAVERSRHQQRANRRLRGLLVTAAVLMLVAVAAGLVAVRQAGRADRQALLAEAGRAGVKAVVEPDIDRSLLLAVASARSERSSETLGSLLAALAKYPQLVRSIPTEQLDVTALEVSPDGTKAALHDVGGDVVVYDLATGAQVGSFRPRPAPSGALLSGVTSGGADYSPLDYSADGRVLAVGLAGLSRRPVRLLDPDTLRPLAHQQPLTFPVPSNLAKLQFSKDGTTLLAVTHDFADGIREPLTGATLATWGVTPTDAGLRLIPRLRRDLGLESEAGLSPDGRIVYTTNPLTAYDARSERVLWRRPGGGVEKLDVSPDGRLLALTARDSDQTDVVLVDAATGHTRRRLAGHAGELTVARFSPSGTTLVSTAVDRTGIVWNVATGRVVTRLPLSRSRVYGVGFSPDDSRLYTASDDGALRTWTLSGASRTLQQVKPPGEFVFGCTYPGPGGRRIATLGPKGIRFTNLASGHTTVWDSTVNLDHILTCGSWHPDGRHFVTTALGIVRVFDSDTGLIVHEAKVQASPLADLDYSGGTGSRIVVGDETGRARLLDSDTLRQVGGTIRIDAPVRWVSEGPDGRTALLVTGGKALSTEADAGASQYEAPSTGWVLVDFINGRVLRQGKVGLQDAWQPWFSPDGRHVAIGGSRGEVEILDTETGRFLRPPVQAHQKGVQYVAWSRDGSRLVSSGFDGTVSLFDGTTGTLLGTVVADTLIASADFEPDGRTVLIATNYQGVYRWNTGTEHLVALACAMTSRDLTTAEWAESFGARPYEPTCPRDNPAG